jgi:hypothetical protein
MALNAFEVIALHNNMICNSNVDHLATAYASEFPLISDNLNGALTRYVCIMGCWANLNRNSSAGAFFDASWSQINGQNLSVSDAYRPYGGYFIRNTWFCDVADGTNNYRSGYVGSFVGGYIDNQYGHDPNGSGVDYEPIYGHASTTSTGTPFPMPATFSTMYRDSSHLPNDAHALIVNNGSAYSKTQYMPPSSFLIHMTSPNNSIASGDLTFIVEERPSLQIAGLSSTSPLDSSGTYRPTAGDNGPGNSGAQKMGGNGPFPTPSIGGNPYLLNTLYPYEYYYVSGKRKLNSRSMSILFSKIFDNSSAATCAGIPYEEDGSISFGISAAANASSGSTTYTGSFPSGANKLAGLECTISGFETNPVANNGFFSITASTATTITVNNPNGIAETIPADANIFLTNTYQSQIGSGPSSQSPAADVQTEYLWQRSATQVGAASPYIDARIRGSATFVINTEYYGMVMDTKCLIFSNKASMVPILFFDLADTWTASTHPRIAGVAVSGIPTGSPPVIQTDGSHAQVYFLSEDGYLAMYDFTVAGGQISLLSSAPAVAAAGESYGALCASSDGTKLYALYGTMTPDPRTTQTGLANTANIGVVVYDITTSPPAWGSYINSGLSARHNGRNLHEMTILRDGRLAILCEDVAVSAGFNVSNTLGSTNTAWQLIVYDPTAGSPWNASIMRPSTPLVSSGAITQLQMTSDQLFVTVSNTFSADDFVTFGGILSGQFQWLNGITVQVLASGLSGSGFTANFVAPNTGPISISSGHLVRGLQYGQDYLGNDGTFPNVVTWFANPNAFIHEVEEGTLLLQGNWTCGVLFTATLGSVGVQPTAVFECVSCQSQTANNIVPTTVVNGSSEPQAFPCDIRTSRDYATGGGGATTGQRTIMWFQFNVPISTSTGGTPTPLHYAPPSFVWDGNTQMSTWVDRNACSGGYITSWNKDLWTFGYLLHGGGDPSVNPYWLFPIMLNGNYLTFVNIDSYDQEDGYSTGIIYGKVVTQDITYLPTYWKWAGSPPAWVIADSWQDAVNNPHPVPSTANTNGTTSPNGVNVDLPWGLVIQFGGLNAGTSYGLNEFHTYNVCYGNTKFSRKARYTWAMFAGQTLLQTDTRTMASQNAMSIILKDTEWMGVTVSGPNSLNGGSSSPWNGWHTQITYPKLNSDNSVNGTPLVMIITTNDVSPADLINSPMITAGTPYVATSNGDQSNSQPWYAFAGDPGRFWRSSLGPGSSPYVSINLGSGETVLAYSFRTYYDNTDAFPGAPTAWTLQGSNTGAFSGEQVTVDTRSSVVPTRGAVWTCNGTTGLYQYYRLVITATHSTSQPVIGMIQFLSAAPTNSLDFTDISFLSHGSNSDTGGFDPNWPHDGCLFEGGAFARGLKFEVSTNGGSVYTDITDTCLWRAADGYVWTFPRQTGVTNVRITCQTPYNYANGTLGTNNIPLTAGFGPVYFYDYGVSQVTLNAARLGNQADAGQTPTNPAAGSWDGDGGGSPPGTYGAGLGVATDAVTISIDGGSPNNVVSMYTQGFLNAGGPTYVYTYANNWVEKISCLAFFDFHPISRSVDGPNFQSCFKVHPYYGFVLFEGAGPSGAVSLKSGANMSITYHWGKKV